MRKLKIVTDASCHRTTFYKGKSAGAAQFYDGDTGELIREEKFALGEMTLWAAEYKTVLIALDVASEITRGKVTDFYLLLINVII
jgi:ribonuclease HI